MRAAILDTNVYRAASYHEFGEMLRLERLRGVYAVADPWTIKELIAGVSSRDARKAGSSLSGIKRLASRSLRNDGHVVMPASAQARMLLFAEEASQDKQDVQALADCALTLASSPSWDQNERLATIVRAIAEHTSTEERQFAEQLRNLADQMRRNVEERGLSAGRDLRAHLQSESTLRTDAESTIVRTYRGAGREPPSPIPEQLIDEVVRVFRAGFTAMAVALERVCCDGASLSHGHNRNLLWDQEIAHNLGQTIGDQPSLVVTDDRIFAVAARRCALEGATLSFQGYLGLLRASAP